MSEPLIPARPVSFALRTSLWLSLALPVAVGLLITVLLLVPHPFQLIWDLEHLRRKFGHGYALHFTVYLMLTTAMLFLQSHLRFRRALIWCGLIGHAALTEFAQMWIPTRDADILDFGSNILGMATAWLLWEIVGAKKLLGRTAPSLR